MRKLLRLFVLVPLRFHFWGSLAIVLGVCVSLTLRIAALVGEKAGWPWSRLAWLSLLVLVAYRTYFGVADVMCRGIVDGFWEAFWGPLWALW